MDAYSETLNTIYNLRGGVIDLRLDRMNQALSLFDHPEKQFPSFHVAGTNGKGSTAAMLHRILSQSGYHVALYTSPHLVSFTERIRVGDEEIAPDEVVALAHEIWDRTAGAHVLLTFFEFVTVMAFIHFARRKIDVAVVEVGLGGRLDATNLVRPVVSLISTISKDHEAYLGSDLLSIAREKGGIIKQGIPVVCGALPTDVAALLENIANEHHAPSYFLSRDFTFSLKNNGRFDYRGLKWRLVDLVVALRGRHQKRNAALALAGLEIAGRDFPVTQTALREGLKTVRWPGRFEIVQDRPAIVLDGAHNGEGVRALIEELENFREQRRVKLLFASMEDKDWRLMLESLSEVVDEIVLTRVNMGRCADPFYMAAQLGGKVAHRAIGNPRSALDYVLDGADSNDVILIAGSLYLIGEIRPIVQEIAAAKSVPKKMIPTLQSRKAMRLGKSFGIRALLAIVAISCVAPAWGQTTPDAKSGADKIDVTADSLSFGEGGTQIEAKGNVQVKREVMTLKADEVRINRETNDMEAKGRVSLDDPSWKVKSAESMQFNLQKETGEVQKGEMFIEEGHVSVSGQRLQKFGGQTYHIDQGFFTTCVCESGPAHWRISADEVDLTLEGTGIIRHGYFYVYDIPVLYIPYGVIPLQAERQTGFLFPEVGQSGQNGFRYLQPFFWAISKSTDATLSFNVETKTRLGVLGEFRTKFNQESDFQFQPSFFNELFRKNADADIVDKTIAEPHIPLHRWGVVGTHRYTTETDWLTYSDFGAYSDTLFTRELVDRFDLPATRERTIQASRFGRSQFGVFRSWGDTYFNGDWRFYQDFIQPAKTTLQRTPEVSFWGRRFLSGLPLEFRWRAESVSYLRRQDCPGTGGTTGQCGDGLRLDLRPEVVLPFKLASYLFGSVSVAPRETAYYLYSPVNPGDRGVSRELVEIRGNIGTTLSRIFSWGDGGASAIRHVLEPELSYFFVPGVNQDKIPIMDDVDRVRRRNVLTFAVGNRFWRRSGGPATSDAPDKEVESLNPFISNVQELGSLRLALGYNIAAARKGADSLTDLDMNLRLTPTDFLNFAFDGGISPGSWEVTQGRATVAFVDPRPITRRALDPDFLRPNAFTIGYRYLVNGPNGFLASNANINLDENPANCTRNPTDPRCPGAPNPKSILGDLVATLFYHVTDNILMSVNSTYSISTNKVIGVRAAVKLLSPCDCWTLTLAVNQTINPAQTSFSFNFSLLGLGAQKRNTL